MIIRAKKQRRFTTVDNQPFQDRRLHWDTRGLLGYLLTKPDGWEIRIEDLLKQEEPEDGSRRTGKEKIFRMLRELKRYGYLYRTQVNGSDGRFETICEVYESPDDNPYYQEAADGEVVEPQPFPELDVVSAPADEPADDKTTVVGNGDHGYTAVGKAVHGKAVNGTAVIGKDDHIVNTDLSKNGEESKNRKKEKTDLPPHMRGWDALHDNGLSPEGQRLMNDIRVVFSFYSAEDALDAARALLAADVTDWAADQQLLLDTLRRVAKGVNPATMFRDWLSLWGQGATGDEVGRLFGNNRDTSWWLKASGMRGMPWPSQVATNLAVAREWELAPPTVQAAQQTTGPKKTTQAADSLRRFEERLREIQGAS